MKLFRIGAVGLVAAMLMLLAGCSKSTVDNGSGGGSGSGNNWDSMTWDQGNWS